MLQVKKRAEYSVGVILEVNQHKFIYILASEFLYFLLRDW